MAAYRDINNHTKREILDSPLLKEIFRRAGSPRTLVVITEGMSQEEEEMEVIAGFLKEGCSFKEAEKKAKEWVRIMSLL